jgi:tetratricopeptide repeat protein 30
LDAIITQQTSPSEAYQKLDELASRYTELLRKLTKQVQEHRNRNDTEMVKKTVVEYEECLDRYIPVLMAQAKILLGLGELSTSREDIPEECRVLQRQRHVEVERGARAVYAREQV